MLHALLVLLGLPVSLVRKSWPYPLSRPGWPPTLLRVLLGRLPAPPARARPRVVGGGWWLGV